MSLLKNCSMFDTAMMKVSFAVMTEGPTSKLLAKRNEYIDFE